MIITSPFNGRGLAWRGVVVQLGAQLSKLSQRLGGSLFGPALLPAALEPRRPGAQPLQGSRQRRLVVLHSSSYFVFGSRVGARRAAAPARFICAIGPAAAPSATNINVNVNVDIQVSVLLGAAARRRHPCTAAGGGWRLARRRVGFEQLL